MAKGSNPLSEGKLHRAITRDANERQMAVDRLKRWVSAAALFEVLNLAEASRKIAGYAIKGGFAVELRHGALARTSEDIDLILASERDAIDALRAIMPANWDSFHFRIGKEEPREHVVRVDLRVVFNNVHWGTLKLDVIDEQIQESERVPNVAIERYGLPPSSAVICISRATQMAQWIHGATRPQVEGSRKNRARNLVDMYLFDTLAPSDDAAVRQACVSTFERELSHAWPPSFAVTEQTMMTVTDVVNEIGLEVTPDELVAYVSRYITRICGQSGPIVA